MFALTLARLGLAIIWAHAAQAATWVLNGEEPAARARVAGDLQVDPSELTWEGLDARVAELPFVLVGNATVRECEGAGVVDAPGLLAEFGSAERALDYAEFEPAQAALDRFFADLPCLNEPIDPDKIARGYFIQALVALGRGDKSAALTAFGNGLAVTPDMTWDANYPPAGIPVFEQAKTLRAAAVQARLRVLPQASRLFVNGARSSTADSWIALVPGSHLIQIQKDRLTGFVIEAGDGQSAVLLRTSSMLSESTRWADDAEYRGFLSTIFTALFDPDDRVAVHTKTGTWVWQEGTKSWRFHTVPADDGSPGQAIFWARWSGAALGVGSGAIAVVNLRQAQDWADQVNNATTGTEQTAAFEEFERADGRWVVSRNVALASTVLFGASWALHTKSDARWRPFWGPHTIGIAGRFGPK